MLRKINSGTVLFAVVILLNTIFATADSAEVVDKNEPKIVIPNDAIIIPYSPDNITPNKLPKPDSLTESDQSVIVPLALHLGMLDLIKSFDKKRLTLHHPSPIRVTAAAAEYTATELPQTGNELILNGKIHIYQYNDEGTVLPFRIQNSVIESPKLNNKPASVSSISNSQFVLYINGKGEHIFTFKVRVKIQQQGGWRIAAGILPTASTSKIHLTLPAEAGDLLTGNPLDVRKWISGKDTTGTNKKITTTLEPNGNFEWRWRSAISEGQVDRSLEVESVIRFDLQDDAAWILWMPTFKISRGKWEVLRLQIPKTYTIAEVAGENVRGWNIVTKNNETENNNTQIINIDLLKPAEKEETLQVRLMNTNADKKSDTNETWKLSTLSVPEAGIHRGRIDLHRSSSHKFRVAESKGVVLTDQPQRPIPITTAKFNATTPLGSVPFQSYRFISEPFDLSLESSQQKQNVNIYFQSILKVTPKRSVLESKIDVNTNNDPFFATITLPKEFKLKNVTAPDTLFYSNESRNGENLLHVSHGNKTNGTVSVVLEGEYIPIVQVDKVDDKNNTDKLKNISQRYKIDQLPVFAAKFAGVDSNVVYKSSAIELLTDPSLSARAIDLKNCWLKDSRAGSSDIRSPREQWNLVRLIIGSSSSSFGAKLLFDEVEPDVRCSTITNVRTTNEAVNETILFDFTINRAGIREVKFTLPEWMKDAVIEAPFLQRKKITEREVKNSGTVLKLVDVTLELQESVIDHLRVLVHADRKLRAETEYRIFVPIIETGIATSQYVVMENDRMSPDEMVVDQPTIKNLKNLDRRQQEWTYLASMLGENVTEAYYAQKTNSDPKSTTNTAAEISLAFKMKRRDAVRLSEARINKAETRLVFDRNGEYRAEQIYHIDNQKEPYLDIILPAGASLWGVRFFTADTWQQRDSIPNNSNQNRPEGTPVKPCLMTSELIQSYEPKLRGKSAYPLSVRIPLIKTESGDLDYVVRIVYAGTSRGLRNFTSAELPFINVLNVPVGTSLLKLYLPEEYKYFFYGNMQHVKKEQTTSTIQKINDEYTQQLGTRLQKTIEKDSNVYAQQRALSNIQNSVLFQNNEVSGSGIAIDLRNTAPTNINQSGIAGSQQQQIAQPTTPQQDYNSKAAEMDYLGSNSGALRSQFMNQSNTFSGQIVNRKSIVIKESKSADKSVVINNPAEQLLGIPAVIKDENTTKSTKSKSIDNNGAESERQSVMYKGNFVLGNTSQINRQLAIEDRDNVSSSTKNSGSISQLHGTTDNKNQVSVGKENENANSEVISDGNRPTTALPPQSSVSPRRQLFEDGARVYDDAISGGDSRVKVFDRGSGSSFSPFNQVLSENGKVLRDSSQVQFRSLSARTSGLDISVPYAGELYIFMMPQGSLDLSFRAVSLEFRLRLIWFFVSIFCVGLVYVGYKGCLLAGKRFVFDRPMNLRLGVLALLLTLLSFILGMVVIFIATLIASIILWINFFRTK
ncbi:MAG: hypothetical protein LBT09_00775 [Planctomycetaceae bacterium]|jgi:hypothetical protein|nr:hypothetical protein [Planctomycetaceae bacterium]